MDQLIVWIAAGALVFIAGLIIGTLSGLIGQGEWSRRDEYNDWVRDHPQDGKP